MHATSRTRSLLSSPSSILFHTRIGSYLKRRCYAFLGTWEIVTRNTEGNTKFTRRHKHLRSRRRRRKREERRRSGSGHSGCPGTLAPEARPLPGAAPAGPGCPACSPGCPASLGPARPRPPPGCPALRPRVPAPYRWCCCHLPGCPGHHPRVPGRPRPASCHRPGCPGLGPQVPGLPPAGTPDRSGCPAGLTPGARTIPPWTRFRGLFGPLFPLSLMFRP